MADQALNTKLTIDDRTGGALSQFGDKLKGLSEKVKGFNLSAGGLTSVAAGASVAGAAVLGLGVMAVNTAGKFEKFQSILTNTFQSSKEAAASMQLLKEVSAQTPFELDKLTESYIKLVNRGFKPTKTEITQLGDLASSLGKDFDMLVEALLDAQTGEMERLKEFGIRAQQSGDKVAFTFKGVTTTVKKTDDAIRDYILSLGNLEGVQGSMDIQSKTLEGKISNLKDAWTNLSATIGEMFLPVSKAALDSSTSLLNSINDNVKEVKKWGDSTSENVVFVALAFEKLKSATTGLNNLGNGFASNMDIIGKAIAKTIPGMSLAIKGFERLINLIGVYKNNSGAAQIAQSNALKQSGSAAVSPFFVLDGIKEKAAAGKLEIEALDKSIKDLKPPTTNSFGGSGSKASKEKDAENKKQIEQEQALLKLTAQRLQEVEKLKISETRKAQLIISINEEAEAELKKIRGDDIKDQEGYFAKLKETAAEKLGKVKDSFKGMYEAVKGAMSKSKDEVDKLTDKIQNSLDKIKSLQDSISELGKDTQQGLSDRFIEINKELADAQSSSHNFDSIAEAEKFNKRLADLQREREFIIGKIGQEAADKAVAFSELSPAEQLQQKADMKKAELQLQIDSENEKVKLLEDQRAKEQEKMDKFNQTKIGIEKKYTQLFKDELGERTEAFAGFIRDIEALESASKSGIKNLINTQTTQIDGKRALGGTIEAGKTYLVGENGPEIISSAGTSRVTPNSGIGGSTTINNYYNIQVAKEVDGDKFISKVKNELINDAKLYHKGIKR